MDYEKKNWFTKRLVVCLSLAITALLLGAYQYVGRAQVKDQNADQQPFNLRLGYQKDQVLAYEGTARVLVERDHVKDVPPTRETEMDFSWKVASKEYVLKADAEEVTILSAVDSDLLGTYIGQTVSVCNKGLRFLRIRRDGSTVSAPDYFVLWGPMVANPNYGLLPAALPAGKVKVGERWSSETELWVGDSSLRHNAEGTLMGIGEMQGRKALRLQVSWGPVAISHGGRERGQEEYWLDTETGVLVGLDAELIREAGDALNSVTTTTTHLRLRDIHDSTQVERKAIPEIDAIAQAYLQVDKPMPVRSADACKRLASALDGIRKLHPDGEYAKRAAWQASAFSQKSKGSWREEGHEK